MNENIIWIIYLATFFITLIVFSFEVRKMDEKTKETDAFLIMALVFVLSVFWPIAWALVLIVKISKLDKIIKGKNSHA